MQPWGCADNRRNASPIAGEVLESICPLKRIVGGVPSMTETARFSAITDLSLSSLLALFGSLACGNLTPCARLLNLGTLPHEEKTDAKSALSTSEQCPKAQQPAQALASQALRPYGKMPLFATQRSPKIRFALVSSACSGCMSAVSEGLRERGQRARPGGGARANSPAPARFACAGLWVDRGKTPRGGEATRTDSHPGKRMQKASTSE